MRKINYPYLIGFVVLCLLIGFSSSQLSDTQSDWFNALEKPVFYPPTYLFGLVWTILYIMIGVAIYLVWEKTKEKLPFILFGVQLILNFFWTIIFFTWQSILAAIIEILALWALILYLIISYRKYSKTASYLLIPYLLWVSFATILTITIYAIN